MRIVLIHSGKEYFESLGSHYSPLIKHSMHLIPICDYLRLKSVREKQKYRPIQCLPTGSIVGIALFDDSFWMTPQHVRSDPWAHGPYCYHIKDAFALTEPVVCRGLPGIWQLAPNIRAQVRTQVGIVSKLAEWERKYHVSAEGRWNAITIMQPFAEAIVRNIKRIENRSSRIFKVNDGSATSNHGAQHLQGCRLCIEDTSADDSFDYKTYGKQFDAISCAYNKKMSQYGDGSKFRFHRYATLVECKCNGGTRKRASKKQQNDIQESAVETRACKKRKCNLRPVRGGKRPPAGCEQDLLKMGFEAEMSRQAGLRFGSAVSSAVSYLSKLKRIRSPTQRKKLGYTEQLKGKKMYFANTSKQLVSGASRKKRKLNGLTTGVHI